MSAHSVGEATVRTELCAEFGIEYPIFAFSHCRDVVVAVSKAGGFGVLGAGGFSPGQLEIELSWIDDHIEGKPYGFDVVLPARFEDTGEDDRDLIESKIPPEHHAFVESLLERFAVQPLPPDSPEPSGVKGWTPTVAKQQIDVALRHPISVLVNALGTPPPEIMQRCKDGGIKVGALAGRVEHAQRHVADGVDFVVAVGTEAGGHTGEISTMVLVPEIVDAAAPVPVVAAGGIGRGRQIAAALALGAQGVWMGSVWLATAESSSPPETIARFLRASSADTVRSRSMSGKPVRMLRSPWSDAWTSRESPGTLGMPLQGWLTADAVARFEHYHRADLLPSPVGQIVGSMNQVRSVNDVIFEMVEEYIATMARIDSLNAN
jgi:NAD(P)H-dependent flavin oxidoreductase YrpB (nitropropane dioxygenase family)